MQTERLIAVTLSAAAVSLANAGQARTTTCETRTYHSGHHGAYYGKHHNNHFRSRSGWSHGYNSSYYGQSSRRSGSGFQIGVSFGNHSYHRPRTTCSTTTTYTPRYGQPYYHSTRRYAPTYETTTCVTSPTYRSYHKPVVVEETTCVTRPAYRSYRQPIVFQERECVTLPVYTSHSLHSPKAVKETTCVTTTRPAITRPRTVVTNPQPAPDRSHKIQSLMNRGWDQLRSGKFHAARNTFGQVASFAPANAKAKVGIALAAAATGDDAAADTAMRRAFRGNIETARYALPSDPAMQNLLQKLAYRYEARAHGPTRSHFLVSAVRFLQMNDEGARAAAYEATRANPGDSDASRIYKLAS